METIYPWIGRIIVWGALSGAALWLFVRWPVAYAVGWWVHFLNSDRGNLWWVCKDFLHYLFTGRARWQKAITFSQTHEMLAGWNNRESHMRRFRRTAPYRRNLLAWIVRRQRAAGLLKTTKSVMN